MVWFFHMVLMMPIDFHHVETAKEADSREKVEVNNDQYPQLSEKVCELLLQCQKAVLHQYMAVARHECHCAMSDNCILTLP